MIRACKSGSHSGGWLDVDPAAIPIWAGANGFIIDQMRIGHSPSRGVGFFAQRPLARNSGPILHVPKDMVLCETRIREMTAADPWLKEILTACLPFAHSARIFIMLFLLYQATKANPQVEKPRGTWRTPFIG
jgi:hypothetical protein